MLVKHAFVGAKVGVKKNLIWTTAG